MTGVQTCALPISYKQPITKPDLEQIRGVSCDYSIQKLLEKELIVIAGKSDGPGKPILYGTSKTFMDHFGLRSVKDLPKLKDIQQGAASEIGIPTDLMDIPVDEAPADAAEDGIFNEKHVETGASISEDQGISNETESSDSQENAGEE